MDQAEANVLVRRIFDEVIDGDGFERSYDEVFAPDFVDHGMVGDVVGKDAFREYLATFKAAISQLRHEVSDVIVVDDVFAVWQVHMTGRFTGELMGVPGDGRALELTTVNVGRMRDGKAVEHWGPGPDGAQDLLRQLGFVGDDTPAAV